jgi:hypothetical protein
MYPKPPEAREASGGDAQRAELARNAFEDVSGNVFEVPGSPRVAILGRYGHGARSAVEETPAGGAHGAVVSQGGRGIDMPLGIYVQAVVHFLLQRSVRPASRRVSLQLLGEMWVGVGGSALNSVVTLCVVLDASVWGHVGGVPRPSSLPHNFPIWYYSITTLCVGGCG